MPPNPNQWLLDIVEHLQTLEGKWEFLVRLEKGNVVLELDEWDRRGKHWAYYISLRELELCKFDIGHSKLLSAVTKIKLES